MSLGLILKAVASKLAQSPTGKAVAGAAQKGVEAFKKVGSAATPKGMKAVGKELGTQAIGQLKNTGVYKAAAGAGKAFMAGYKGDAGGEAGAKSSAPGTPSPDAASKTSAGPTDQGAPQQQAQRRGPSATEMLSSMQEPLPEAGPIYGEEGTPRQQMPMVGFTQDAQSQQQRLKGFQEYLMESFNA